MLFLTNQQLLTTQYPCLVSMKNRIFEFSSIQFGDSNNYFGI